MPVYVSEFELGQLEQENVSPPGQFSSADDQSIASLADGGYLVSYNLGSATFVRLYDADGAPRGEPFAVGVSNMSGVDVVGLPDGGFVMVWSSSPVFVQAQFFDANGSPTTSVIAVDGANNREQQPDVTILEDGSVLVAWRANSDPQSVQARILGDDGTFLSDPFTVVEGSNSTQFSFPQIAALPEGGFVVTWQDDGTVRAQAFSDTAQPVGTLVDLSDDGTTAIGQRYQSIKILEDGNYLLVWNETYVSSSDLIFGAVFTPAGIMVGARFQVNTNTDHDSGQPFVEVLNDGSFVVAWRLAVPGEGPNYFQIGDVMARRFSSDGQPIGDEFRINDGTGLGQDTPLIAAFGTDDVAFVWRNWAEGSTRSDVQLVNLYSVTNGTNADDTLSGTDGVDFLRGLDGNDNLLGGGGNDVLDAGNGNDELNGGEGDDEFHDNGGNNIFVGGPGDDDYFVLGTGSGQQFIENPGEGFDTIFVTGRFRSLELPENFESGVIVHGDGATLRGNSDANLLIGNDNTNVIYGQDGDDILEGRGGTDRLEGGEGNDQLFGGSGNDVLIGGDGVDLIDGGEGDDQFVIFTSQVPSAGEVWTGGAGVDQIELRVAGFAISMLDLSILELSEFEELRSTRDLTARVTLDQLVQFEAVDSTISFELSEGGTVFTAQVATSDADGLRLTLSDEGNVVDDRGNSQRGLFLQGSAANDTAFAGDIGGELFGFGGTDMLFGGASDDLIDGGDDSDFLTGGLGNDTLDGGSNVDTAVFSGNMADYTITQASTGVFQVVGADGTDTLTAIEFAQFDDQMMRLLPGTGVSVNFETADPSVYQGALEGLRDFDGNDLGGDGNWLRIGSADVNGDGDIDQILVNDAIGRFATVGTAGDGMVYFDDHSWAGETRVAGIYIDPLVESGDVIAGGDNDSQRRFQNDLEIENINRVLGADDYDGDGIQEVFFALTDGTAYLRALTHDDGNIRYANYQSEQEVIDYLTANGFDDTTFGDWFGSSENSSDTITFVADDELEKQVLPSEGLLPIHDRDTLAQDSSEFIFSQQQGEWQALPFQDVSPEFFG